MYRHRYFDLCLHDDAELASLLQSSVVERVTLHEWPLSCVQRLVTSDGRRVVYKTQYGPTVESELYATARCNLLPSAKTVYVSEGHVCMLFDFIEGPAVSELDLADEEIARVGRMVTAQIAEIAGQLPYFIDISTEEKWRVLIDATLEDIRQLIARGRFNLVDEAKVRQLKWQALSEPVLSAVHTNPGYIHGDLTGDNVFMLSDGYRVIDWQRPMLGPTDLDLATLTRSLGLDPLRFVDRGIVQVLDFLHICWFTQCAARWIPQAAEDYDQRVARLASLIGGSGA